MTLTVTGRHIELSPLVRQQIQTKFARLERLLNDSAVSAQVIVTKERQAAVCEVTLHARGDHMLVGVGRHARILTAVGEAIDKVKQQAQRLSDRWKTRRRNGPRLAEITAAPAVKAKAKANGSAVVRARRYAVKSQSVDEAAARLGAAPFLVFRQAVTGRVAVVFRRPDGKVGLIEPED
ncbi:MAG: ribosome-associated translation inhibitor RaiA [Acidobacteria bacterium]|nr:ribosome-associated translation inhibitor RaiA [Acidobacteriota bacterium]